MQKKEVKMTEQEALDSLMSDLIGEQPQQEPTPEQIPQVVPQAKEEPKSDLPDIKAMLENQSKMIEELKTKVESKPEAKGEPTPEQIAEQEMIRKAQEQLGITQLIEQQKAQEAERQRTAQFQAEEKNFKQLHPEVNLEELAQWAQGNGYEKVLGLGSVGWSVIAKAMEAQSKPVSKPDPITPATSQGAEPSAFDRLQKGEKVTPIEAGEDLLRTAGLYK